jgi:hypothetical protein
MKNTFLLLTLLLTLQVSAEKGLKAIKAENLITNQGQVSVSYGDYNSDLDNIKVLSSLKFLGKQYVEGSLIVSELENRAYYLVSGNGSAELVVLNAETGAVTKRNPIHGTFFQRRLF